MASPSLLLDDGRVNLGDPCAVIDGDLIGVLESVYHYPKTINAGITKYMFRLDADASLTGYDADELRVLTAEELSDRNDAITLAAAQATFDAASTALTGAGGDPCDGCGE